MQQSSQILLDIWREACRHIEIDEFVTTAFNLLNRQAPLAQLLIRRFDREHSDVATVAAMPCDEDCRVAENRRSFSDADWKQVAHWGGSGRVLKRGDHLSGTLGLILPQTIDADILAVPLAHGAEASGALLWIAHPGCTFDETHQELIERLREPFSVALENDRRVHEMAALREAAEADRGSLLRRLGRTELVESIVGEQTGLKLVMERVGLVATSDVPVLVLGETGTGKEVVARAIHARSERHDGPFLRVNCGAIPRELIDSQLFGHERGSFTGAEQTRHGWFERADKGTLLLDEIGELPLEAQVRLLRVLQDGFVERVGGTHPVHVDVRIVAATHRDLAQMVRENTFREDLWYRLAVFPILMPPLRDRKVDIPDLSRHFAERAALRFGLTPTVPTDADLELLSSYSWPGNIRELGAVIDRAAILGNGQSLEIAKSLGFTNTAPPSPPRTSAAERPRPRPARQDDVLTLDQAIIAHIEQVLERTQGRIEGPYGAAELLDVNPHTLRSRMRKLGINWARFRSVQTGNEQQLRSHESK